MNGTIGRLGGLYGLSPATLAGLASVSGLPEGIDPSWTQPAPAPAPPPPPSMDPMANAHSPNGGAPSVFQSAAATQPFNPPAPVDASMAGPPVAGPSMDTPSTPSVTTPAHWAGSTREFGREGGMSPDDGQAYGEARMSQLGHEQGALIAEQKNQGILGRAAEETGLPIVIDNIKHEMEMRRQWREQDRAKYIQENTRAVETQAAKANAEIDPGEAFGGTFGRVLAAIAIGLGQFGATLTKTENGAARIIDGAIRDSIDKQKSNIANAKGSLGDMRRMRMEHLQDLDDQNDRDYANHLVLIDQAKQMTLNWAKNMGYDASAPQVGALLAKLDGQRADVLKDIAVTAGGKYHEKLTEKMKEATTTGGGTPAKREGNLVTTADGTTYKFDSDKSAEEGRAKLQSFGDVQLLTNEILRIRKETMKLDPLVNRQEYESNMLKLKTLDDQLSVADSKANGQGTVTEADAKRRKEVGLDATAGLGAFKGIGRIVGTSYDAANSAYEQSLKTNSDRQRGYIQAASPSIYNRDYARDKDGNLVPTGSYTGQDAKPAERLLPQGSKPLDGRARPNTAGASDASTTPYAPVQKGVYRATPAATHGKKKK